ncbi:predicted protein [Streptomyces sp. AA4]|nr:predicted protein [Streptomyces sp. AA4]
MAAARALDAERGSVLSGLISRSVGVVGDAGGSRIATGLGEGSRPGIRCRTRIRFTRGVFSVGEVVADAGGSRIATELGEVRRPGSLDAGCGSVLSGVFSWSVGWSRMPGVVDGD